jgi:hypothetical protein
VSFAYLSYSRIDGASAAETIRVALEGAGIDCWLDTRDIDPFQDFTAELERNIEAASHVIVCLTPDSKRPDSFVRREIQYAVLSQKAIIPVKFSTLVPHISIVNLEWVDWSRGAQAPLAHLLKLLRSTPGARHPGTPAPDPFRPYVEALYKRTVDFLERMVLSLVDLGLTSSPGQVANRRPGLDMLGRFFAGHGCEEPPESRRRFSTLQEAFIHYNGRLLLLGDPGAGKTISIVAHARDAAAARLADSSEPLPLLGLVPTWDAAECPELHVWLADGYSELSADAIRDVLEADKGLLLLDGLDELGDQRVVWKTDADNRMRAETFDPRPRFVARIPQRNKVLITCRSKDYESLGSKLSMNGAVTVQQLTDEQIEASLRGQTFLRAAVSRDRDLREMLRTPLVMSLFAFAYADMPPEQAAQATSLAQSPAELRDRIIVQYVTKRYEWESRKRTLPMTLPELLRSLGDLAVTDAARNWGRNLLQDVPLVFGDMAVQLNILVRTGTYAPAPGWEELGPTSNPRGADSMEYRFVHLLIRDVFAFRNAVERAEAADVQYEEAISALTNLPERRAVHALFRFLGQPGARYMAIVALAVRRADLTAELLDDWSGNAASTVRESVLDLVAQLEDETLGHLPVRMLADSAPEVRARAVYAIGRLGLRRARRQVLERLHDTNESVRANAIYALSIIGAGRLVATVAALLDDEASLVRWNAEVILARIGTEEARAALAAWRARRPPRQGTA